MLFSHMLALVFPSGKKVGTIREFAPNAAVCSVALFLYMRLEVFNRYKITAFDTLEGFGWSGSLLRLLTRCDYLLHNGVLKSIPAAYMFLWVEMVELLETPLTSGVVNGLPSPAFYLTNNFQPNRSLSVGAFTKQVLGHPHVFKVPFPKVKSISILSTKTNIIAKFRFYVAVVLFNSIASN